MSQRSELGRPVVRSAAGFDANQAGLQAREEWGHLVTLELLAKHGKAALVNTVHLEYILGQIQTDRRDHEQPPLGKWATPPPATMAAGARQRKGASIPLTIDCS